MLARTNAAQQLLQRIPNRWAPFMGARMIPSGMNGTKGGNPHRQGGRSQDETAPLARPYAVSTRASTASVKPTAAQQTSTSVQELSLLMLLEVTYERLHGRKLFECGDLLKLPAVVWKLPLAVAAIKFDATHSYANKAALEALAGGTQVSSLSAQQLFGQEELDHMLQQLSSFSATLEVNGSSASTATPVQIDSMILQDAAGQPVRVWGMEVMPIDSPSGSRVGFAFAFKVWQHQDGSVAMPGVPPTKIPDLPTAADMEAGAASVRAQADSIRSLKLSGLSNMDPAVQGSVKELQQRKQRFAELEALRQLQDAIRAHCPELLQA